MGGEAEDRNARGCRSQSRFRSRSGEVKVAAGPPITLDDSRHITDSIRYRLDAERFFLETFLRSGRNESGR